MSGATIRAGKRRAWRHVTRVRPGLQALFGTSESRRHFIRAWIFEPCGWAWDFVLHFAFKLLPIDVCSALGAWFGRMVMRYKYPKAMMHMRHNLALMHPEASEAEREAMLLKNCESLGRVMTEFSVLSRICADQDRVRVEGLEELQKAAQEHPIILVGLHLGNWEILPSLTRRSGLQFHTFYLPRGNPLESWIVARTRKKLGAQLLPAAMSGVRPGLRLLRQGGMVSLFCDEGFNGQIRGPLLGRPAHLHGNMALAARLARLSGAHLCLAYVVRGEGARFDCKLGPIVQLPDLAGPHDHQALLEDVSFLNDLIEPVIIQHAEQWRILHFRHEAIK